MSLRAFQLTKGQRNNIDHGNSASIEEGADHEAPSLQTNFPKRPGRGSKAASLQLWRSLSKCKAMSLVSVGHVRPATSLCVSGKGPAPMQVEHDCFQLNKKGNTFLCLAHVNYLLHWAKTSPVPRSSVPILFELFLPPSVGKATFPSGAGKDAGWLEGMLAGCHLRFRGHVRFCIRRSSGTSTGNPLVFFFLHCLVFLFCLAFVHGL